MQSVFLIRSYNDETLRNNSSVELVVVSLLASLFSVASKFVWLDGDACRDNGKDAEWSTQCPFVNGWYLLRVIWRFSYVTTRFCVLSLLWSVLGGVILCIFLPISCCCWCISFFTNVPYSEERCVYSINGAVYLLLQLQQVRNGKFFVCMALKCLLLWQ